MQVRSASTLSRHNLSKLANSSRSPSAQGTPPHEAPGHHDDWTPIRATRTQQQQPKALLSSSKAPGMGTPRAPRIPHGAQDSVDALERPSLPHSSHVTAPAVAMPDEAQSLHMLMALYRQMVLGQGPAEGGGGCFGAVVGAMRADSLHSDGVLYDRPSAQAGGGGRAGSSDADAHDQCLGPSLDGRLVRQLGPQDGQAESHHDDSILQGSPVRSGSLLSTASKQRTHALLPALGVPLPGPPHAALIQQQHNVVSPVEAPASGHRRSPSVTSNTSFTSQGGCSSPNGYAQRHLAKALRQAQTQVTTAQPPDSSSLCPHLLPGSSDDDSCTAANHPAPLPYIPLQPSAAAADATVNPCSEDAAGSSRPGGPELSSPFGLVQREVRALMGSVCCVPAAHRPLNPSPFFQLQLPSIMSEDRSSPSSPLASSRSRSRGSAPAAPMPAVAPSWEMHSTAPTAQEPAPEPAMGSSLTLSLGSSALHLPATATPATAGKAEDKVEASWLRRGLSWWRCTWPHAACACARRAPAALPAVMEGGAD